MNPRVTETERVNEPDRGTERIPARRRGSRVWLYTIPAIALALFAGLGYWRVQERDRVRAELFPAATQAQEITVAVTHPTRSDTSRE